MQVIEFDKEKCKLCYACVRVCPTKAIAVKTNEEYPQVLHNRCIGCGSCLSVCSPEALTFIDSTLEVQNLLKSGVDTIAIVAPSISGEFPDITDYRKFVSMIRALGFKYVNEVSFGADLVAAQYKDLMSDFKGKYYLSSLCPSLTAYIQSFYPELTENLTPIVNPMVATAKVVRKKYGDHINVVYICPCVSAKDEARLHTGDGRVEAVLTFTELRKMFEAAGITEHNREYSEFDGPIGHLGSLFPISNGLLQAVDLDESLLNGEIITIEGKENFLDAIKQFSKYTERIRRHFNIFYCDGCMMGPGTSSGGEKYLRRTLVTEYANKRLKAFTPEEFERSMTEYTGIELSCSFKPNDQRIAMPPAEKIEEILKVIGKHGSNPYLGCGACGYESCHEFAIAVAKGLAKPEMCLTYNLRNQIEYIRTLKGTNEKLAKTESALKNSEKTARREQQASQDANEIITAMLQKLPSGVVIVDEHLKIIQANKTFVEILGEDARMIDEVIPGLASADLKSLLPYTFYNLFSYVLKNNESITNKDTKYHESLLNVSIFPIRHGKIVGAVIRDMYVPEVRKEQILSRINEAIHENLSMVQQIGFLLGEGASKTERMLNSIIQSYRLDEHNKDQHRLTEDES
ncbi:MAG: [Fe-Fe] hydrogenase large subunit C-terminal domain-containing protein [Bacteroidales bacterium]|nr:[Fe-Fe] hydrogenase large subunit C-terminal domain-containing protein [Bacteroidales bacterium]